MANASKRETDSCRIVLLLKVGVFLLPRGVDGCMGCSLYIPVMSHRKEQQERRHAARHSLTQVTFKPPKKDCSTANSHFFNTETAAASILSTLKIRTTNSAPPRSPLSAETPFVTYHHNSLLKPSPQTNPPHTPVPPQPEIRPSRTTKAPARFRPRTAGQAARLFSKNDKPLLIQRPR